MRLTIDLELNFTGLGGLCYSDQSKKAISDLQAVWIRWTECLMKKSSAYNSCRHYQCP